MMKKISTSTRLLVILGLVSGCAVMETKPVATEPDLVSTRIAQAAEKAGKALETISGIAQQNEPLMPPPQDYTSAPPALTQAITLRWSGPVEQILQTLAARAGMHFHSTGNASGVPLLVNIDVYQEPLIEVLHNVGLQLGRRADVSVSTLNNAIEIRYAPVDRI